MKKNLFKIMLFVLGFVPNVFSVVGNNDGAISETRDSQSLQSLLGQFVVKNTTDLFSSTKAEPSKQYRTKLCHDFKGIISKYNLARGDEKKLIDAGLDIVRKEQNVPTTFYETILEELVVQASQKWLETLAPKEQLKFIEEDGFKDGTKNIITKIDLSRVFRNLGTDRLRTIFQKLKQFPKLTDLNISYNDLGETVEATQAFAPSLRVLTGLTHLKIQGNNLGKIVEATQAFALSLGVLTGLIHLDISWNGLGETVEATQALINPCLKNNVRIILRTRNSAEILTLQAAGFKLDRDGTVSSGNYNLIQTAFYKSKYYSGKADDFIDKHPKLFCACFGLTITCMLVLLP